MKYILFLFIELCDSWAVPGVKPGPARKQGCSGYEWDDAATAVSLSLSILGGEGHTTGVRTASLRRWRYEDWLGAVPPVNQRRRAVIRSRELDHGLIFFAGPSGEN